MVCAIIASMVIGVNTVTSLAAKAVTIPHVTEKMEGARRVVSAVSMVMFVKQDLVAKSGLVGFIALYLYD